jgi:hypothetical protein
LGGKEGDVEGQVGEELGSVTYAEVLSVEARKADPFVADCVSSFFFLECSFRFAGALFSLCSRGYVVLMFSC